MTSTPMPPSRPVRLMRLWDGQDTPGRGKFRLITAVCETRNRSQILPYFHELRTPPGPISVLRWRRRSEFTGGCLPLAALLRPKGWMRLPWDPELQVLFTVRRAMRRHEADRSVTVLRARQGLGLPR